MKAGMIGNVGLVLAAWLVATASPPPLAAQTARLRVGEENFRREPNGTPLATVVEGAELAVVSEQGPWVEVRLEGWIWAASVAPTDRGGFDLRVSADGGENLRARPRGAVRARLLEGCLLERMAAEGDWVQVRRSGWIWKGSLDMAEAAATTAAPPSQPPTTAPAADTTARPEAPILTTPTPLIVYSTPDGDTVAVFQPAAQAQVLGRTGDWVRVRLDGWVYGPAALDSVLNLADSGNLTPAQLRSDPGRYRGALIRWRVQFISLRRAERARSDFEEGEPFIQARGPEGDAGFVYLAVPDGLLPVAERIQPLEYFTVVGRVRTGRSSLLGSPVIDVTDIEIDGDPAGD